MSSIIEASNIYLPSFSSQFHSYCLIMQVLRESEAERTHDASTLIKAHLHQDAEDSRRRG